MRRVYALAAVLLLAGCSGQPNDLRDNRYYGDPETTVPPSPTEAPRPMPAAAPATPTTTAQSKPRLDKLALTAADLAAESVQQTGTGVQTAIMSLPDCGVPLDKAEAGYQTAWAYPTGATLRQYLTQYDGEAADVVDAVREKLTCDKVSAPVEAPDGQVSWCATGAKNTACTVLKPDGSLLSVVVVTAATENKAKQAVTRIAPLAATALARNS